MPNILPVVSYFYHIFSLVLKFLGTFNATNYKQDAVKMSPCPLPSITTSSELFYILLEISLQVHFAFTNVLSTFSKLKKKKLCKRRPSHKSRHFISRNIAIKNGRNKTKFENQKHSFNNANGKQNRLKNFSKFPNFSDVRKITFVSLYYFSAATQPKKLNNLELLL